MSEQQWTCFRGLGMPKRWLEGVSLPVGMRAAAVAGVVVTSSASLCCAVCCCCRWQRARGLRLGRGLANWRRRAWAEDGCFAGGGRR